MKLRFLGAAQEVTGSCYLLETQSARILVDCGLFQGSREAYDKNQAAFPFDAKQISAVILTHGHLDHTGRIPKLVREGFTGKIFGTDPTVQIARLIWEDALDLMRYEERKGGPAPLFHEREIQQSTRLCQAIVYDQPVEVAPGIQAQWHDAGHILGSSFVEVQAEEKTLVFSGDLGNSDVPILRDLEKLPNADLLVMESTYGGHIHEDPKTRVEELRQIIKRTVKQQGVLLIPAFAVERIQEILYEISTLVRDDKIPHLPFYLDSPLAIRVTDVFKRFPKFYDREAMKRLIKGDSFFSFPGLQMTPKPDDSKMINDIPPPKVIIAGAGMMTGGRILHHLIRYLPQRSTTVLIVGYQAVGTLGRKLLDGASQIQIFGQSVPVQAMIEKIGGYSAHADRRRLVEWVSSAERRPQRIVLVHGEPDSQEVIGHDLHDQFGVMAERPALGEEIEL